MATSIDDNEADEKSDKPRCQLINIRCTRAPSSQELDFGAVWFVLERVGKIIPPVCTPHFAACCAPIWSPQPHYASPIGSCIPQSVTHTPGRAFFKHAQAQQEEIQANSQQICQTVSTLGKSGAKTRNRM